MASPAIRLDGVGKRFGRGRRQVDALRELSLEVDPGQVYGFLGPNGAGKSTTIRILMDLIRPTYGTAYLFDRPVQEIAALLGQRVGALVEGAAFYGFLSARENLRVLSQTSGVANGARIDRLLEQVGLAAWAEKVGWLLAAPLGTSRPTGWIRPVFRRCVPSFATWWTWMARRCSSPATCWAR